MNLDPRFDAYNTHRMMGIDYFLEHDPQLSRLRALPYSYASPLIQKLPVNESGIYTLGGGRQIGKSTLLKQWMADLLLNKKVEPNQLVYLSGDLIDDNHQLLQILIQVLEPMSLSSLSYIIIDEVTYIKDWDKTIKFLADSGQIDKTILMLSGSDLTMLEEARMRFPGRRGHADVVDFHLYPLSFYEYLTLVIPDLGIAIHEPSLNEKNWQRLDEAFNAYLQHGGYLTAINDFAKNHTIQIATLRTYSDWIRGDILKRGKQERYLKEILSGVIKHYTSQVSWNTLAKSLSIDHHKTVADYVDLLSHMDALFVQYALLEDKLTAAPKKAKKVFFTDPFVYHAARAWLNPVSDPYDNQILPAVLSPIISSELVETVVVSHFRRHYETYYIKAEGEVDIAYLEHKKIWPIEIKWRSQTHAKDLKQISKYKNGCVWTKSHTEKEVNGVSAVPLSLALAKLG